MLTTKEQLREQSKEKLEKSVINVQGDMASLDQELLEIAARKEEINDISPEVFNTLEGIQRDLRFGKDRIKNMYKVLFR